MSVGKSYSSQLSPKTNSSEQFSSPYKLENNLRFKFYCSIEIGSYRHTETLLRYSQIFELSIDVIIPIKVSFRFSDNFFKYLFF